ncbi:MAG: triose-phosphate isomerase [Actinobacteria bacterium HGW-Actinobacteria-5]|jgi:triosephosphate isomerase|nr:MAG: triose-phosphate isomerase [Actinobacteria bacterium HGW-Actinobacteria-5]
MPAQPTLRTPFLIVNPKAYLGGADTLRLALLTNELAQEFDLDVIFTSQQAYIVEIARRTTHLMICAQHMDPIVPGRGMGLTLPESLAEAGATAVVLNHAEHPITLAELDATMRRADDVGLTTIVCADSVRQCRAVAQLEPKVMICEPTANIGTGAMDTGDYIVRSTRAVKEIDPSILVIQAAGVSTGADITRVLEQGADGSGGTSGIVSAPDWRAVLVDMMSALKNFQTSDHHPAGAK